MISAIRRSIETVVEMLLVSLLARAARVLFL
jgi:hypothetical protein